MTASSMLSAFLAALREELEGEEGAAASYEKTTPEHEYHDGRCDGLRWALEFLTGPENVS